MTFRWFKDKTTGEIVKADPEEDWRTGKGPRPVSAPNMATEVKATPVPTKVLRVPKERRDTVANPGPNHEAQTVVALKDHLDKRNKRLDVLLEKSVALHNEHDAGKHGDAFYYGCAKCKATTRRNPSNTIVFDREQLSEMLNRATTAVDSLFDFLEFCLESTK